MQRLWGIILTEWRLSWRTPWPWLAGGFALVWAAGLNPDANLSGAALAAGSALGSLLPFMLALFWFTGAKRAAQPALADLVTVSPFPQAIRISAELTGRFLTGLTLIGALALATLVPAAGLAARESLAGGLLRYLLVLLLVAVPALLAWLAISQIAATWLPAAGGYVALFLLWVLSPRVPDMNSLLPLFGPAARALFTHQVLLLLLGWVIGLLACIPKQRGEGVGLRALANWSLITLAAVLLALPGLFLIWPA